MRVSVFNSQLFKHKAALVGKTVCNANGNSFVKNTRIAICGDH